MTAIFFMAELNGDIVYESTKSPNNFLGPKTHASVKNRTLSAYIKLESPESSK